MEPGVKTPGYGIAPLAGHFHAARCRIYIPRKCCAFPRGPRIHPKPSRCSNLGTRQSYPLVSKRNGDPYLLGILYAICGHLHYYICANLREKQKGRTEVHPNITGSESWFTWPKPFSWLRCSYHCSCGRSTLRYPPPGRSDHVHPRIPDSIRADCGSA